MYIFLYFSIFILGSLIGSFLNVVILRFNTGKGLGGRSGCFSCGKKLTWRELIPIVSFFAQKGKCAGCNSKISWQYPIVEALTGIIFLSIMLKFQDILFISGNHYLIGTAYYLYIFSLLIVISVYDIRHKIIPDKLVYVFLILAALSPFLSPYLTSFHLSSFNFLNIIGGIILALPFFILWFFSDGKWMGFGDVKLALGIGFLLGLGKGIAAIMIAFWIGALAGILLLILKKSRVTMKSEIPFGPFLALGAFIAFIFSLDISFILSMFGS